MQAVTIGLDIAKSYSRFTALMLKAMSSFGGSWSADRRCHFKKLPPC